MFVLVLLQFARYYIWMFENVYYTENRHLLAVVRNLWSCAVTTDFSLKAQQHHVLVNKHPLSPYQSRFLPSCNKWSRAFWCFRYQKFKAHAQNSTVEGEKSILWKIVKKSDSSFWNAVLNCRNSFILICFRYCFAIKFFGGSSRWPRTQKSPAWFDLRW